MSDKKDGGPAFPGDSAFKDDVGRVWPMANIGLTKREWFTGVALMGLLSNSTFAKNGLKIDGKEYLLPAAAVMISDETLKELKK